MPEDFNVDSALAGIENQSSLDREIPMTAEESTPLPVEYEFKTEGKTVKAPIDQILKWAQMGHGAPNHIGELTQKLQGYETQFNTMKPQLDKYQHYAKLDEYFAQNPEHWKHVENSWQQRSQAIEANPMTGEIQSLKNELNEIKKFHTDQINEKLSLQKQKEDQSLSEEVQSIRKQYADLDWASPNETGQTLEQQVIKHAIDNGIKSYRAAFRDFTHDLLMSRVEERGMEKRDKDIQKKTKLGLLGTTPTPTKGFQQASNLKTKSYESLLAEALAEIA